jgi:sarcosine oxidase
MYDVAVVGLGLIGSAAFRHLVDMGVRTVGIGPSEPANLRDRERVFASHYDEGRITRIVDPLPFWAAAGRRSIDAYADLEARSGIRFHHPVGCLRVSADPDAVDDNLLTAEANGRAHGASLEILDAGTLTNRFPYLCFQLGSRAVWEGDNAGYVNPRAMVKAQLISAVTAGGSVIRSAVVDVKRRQGGGIALLTDSGEQVVAKRLLLTSGAWTDMLLDRPLALRKRASTILLAALDESEVVRLSGMPSIIYRLKQHPTLYSIYMLPPITYPDGRTYVKIGGTFHSPEHFGNVYELDAWFHTDGDLEQAEAIKQVLTSMLPGLVVSQYRTAPCVVSYTEHAHPYIDTVAPGIAVGVGGNGAAAKSSNEIGRMAALRATDEAWLYDFDQSMFALRFA